MSKRASNKSVYDFSDIPLRKQFKCLSKRTERVAFGDLTELSRKYPHHTLIIRQLLHGLSYYIMNGQSSTTVNSAHNAVKLLIEFINNKRWPNYQEVRCVAQVDTALLRTFSTYLLALNNKKSTTNYNKVAKALRFLWKNMPDNELVGKGVAIPKPPMPSTSDPVRGYSPKLLKALAQACQKDIVEIIALHKMYDALTAGSEQIPKGKRLSLKKTSPSYYDDKLKLILATLKHQYPDFPFGMPLDEAAAFFRDDIAYDKHIMAIRRALHGCAGRVTVLGGALSTSIVYAASHFTVDTIYPFYLLFQILSGWNIESVEALPVDIDDWVEPNPLKPDEVIIYSFKERGTKHGKVVIKQSKAEGLFTPYGILKYIAKIVSRQSSSMHCLPLSLFQYTSSRLGNANSLIHNMVDASAGSTKHDASIRFLRRHGLTGDFGKTVSHRSIRSGYATMCEMQGMSLVQIQNEMGHSDPTTTADRYLSDESSHAVIDQTIADYQNTYLECMTNYSAKIIESATLQSLRDAVDKAHDSAAHRETLRQIEEKTGLSEDEIIRVISPEARTYILACTDASAPSWVGHKDHVKNGICRHYNKCCQCDKAIVFPEMLPYIARRILHLDIKRGTVSTAEWHVKFWEEYDAWESILASWNNRQQVDDAIEAAKCGKVSLPQVLRGFW
jgi:hypothetical protein